MVVQRVLVPVPQYAGHLAVQYRLYGIVGFSGRQVTGDLDRPEPKRSVQFSMPVGLVGAYELQTPAAVAWVPDGQYAALAPLRIGIGSDSRGVATKCANQLRHELLGGGRHD